jgi:membrane-associated protease RseP (regulator of RpoE activity)
MLTALSTWMFSFISYSLSPAFFDKIMNKNDFIASLAVFQVCFGIWFIQIVHEMAHYIIARAEGIRTDFPIPIPSRQIGTFGCITYLRSFPQTRCSLYNFAFSGPLAGMLASFLAIVIGAYRTVHADAISILSFPVVPVHQIQTSFLAGTFISVVAPKFMLLPLSQPIPIHPLCIAGYVGFISSALNLMPITCLDGGRLCNMVTGTRVAALWSTSTLLFLLSLALSGDSSMALSWLLFIVLFQRRFDIPVRNDVTEVSDIRKWVWYCSLIVVALILNPFPGGAGYL